MNYETRLSVVPIALVPARWHEVKDHLARALSFSNDYTIEQAQLMLSSGQWMLLVAEDKTGAHGAAAVEFFNRPADRVAFVIAAGGKMLATHTVIEQAKAIFKQYGATKIECAARASASRLWARIGYTEKYRIMELPL